MRVLLGALILGLLPVLGGCHHTPAEQQIRDTITAMQKAGERHDIDGIVAPLSDDFIGGGDEEAGPFDRRDFKRFLTFVQMREGGSVHTTIGAMTVALQGTDHATANFDVLVTGGGGLLPRDGQVEDVHTGWRLDSGRWKMISAEWKANAGTR
ncbi:MAG TPA: hypothetical protein VK753_08260 [Xanthomonadaceae bacterium]|nr:hypothetical protein [Xanthomonadaceae bacterium]